MSTSTPLPVFKISPAALARALLRSGRVTDPALAQRVAEKLALRLSARTTEATADQPPAAQTVPSARAIARQLVARGTPIAIAQEKAEKIAGLAAAKAALADRPAAPADPTEPTVTMSTRDLALRIVKSTGCSLEVAQQAAEAQARRQRGAK